MANIIRQLIAICFLFGSMFPCANALALGDCVSHRLVVCNDHAEVHFALTHADPDCPSHSETGQEDAERSHDRFHQFEKITAPAFSGIIFHFPLPLVSIQIVSPDFTPGDSSTWQLLQSNYYELEFYLFLRRLLL